MGDLASDMVGGDEDAGKNILLIFWSLTQHLTLRRKQRRLKNENLVRPFWVAGRRLHLSPLNLCHASVRLHRQLDVSIRKFSGFKEKSFGLKN